MTIARDTNAVYDGGPAAATQTIAYTVGATANAFLGLTTESRALGTNVISGITYNGVAMTKIQGVDQGPGSNYLTSWGLFIAAPDGASHNIVISYSTNDYSRGCIASWNGVSQSGYDAHTERSGSATSNTDSITSVADNCWAILLTEIIGTAYSAGTGSNQVCTTTRGTIFDSNGVITPAGSYSMGTTTSSNTKDMRSQFTLAPVVAATNTNRFFFNRR